MSSIALLVLLTLATVTLATVLTACGLRRRSWLALGAGLGVASSILLAFGLFSTWGAMMWLDEVELVDRSRTVAGATALVSLAAALASALLLALITLPSRHVARRTRRIAMVVVALGGAAWGLSSWFLVLRWMSSGSTGTRELAFGRDAGSYLLTLPLVDALLSLLFLVVLVSAIVALSSTHGRRHAPPIRWPSPAEGAGRS